MPEIKLYVDGKLAGSRTVPATNATWSEYTGPLNIGRNPQVGTALFLYFQQTRLSAVCLLHTTLYDGCVTSTYR